MPLVSLRAAARASGRPDYFFFAVLAAGFEVLVAAVLAVFALEPIAFEPFFAPDLPALFLALIDFDAPLPARLAALFTAPFLAPVFFAAVFLAPPLDAPFAADLRAVFLADFDPEVFDPPVLLLAFAFGAGVLESPMALPAASFMRVMAD
jgi:hypothetical protein